jgi:hypothetical protein
MKRIRDAQKKYQRSSDLEMFKQDAKNWEALAVKEELTLKSLKGRLVEVTDETCRLKVQETTSMSIFDCAMANTEDPSFLLKIQLLRALENKAWVVLLAKKQVEMENLQFSIDASETESKCDQMEAERCAQMHDEIKNLDQEESLLPLTRHHHYPHRQIAEVRTRHGDFSQTSADLHHRALQELRQSFHNRTADLTEAQFRAALDRQKKLELCSSAVDSLQEEHEVAFGVSWK